MDLQFQTDMTFVDDVYSLYVCNKPSFLIVLQNRTRSKTTEMLGEEVMLKEVVWYKSRKPSHAEKATSWKERGQGTMTRVGFEEE